MQTCKHTLARYNTTSPKGCKEQPSKKITSTTTTKTNNDPAVGGFYLSRGWTAKRQKNNARRPPFPLPPFSSFLLSKRRLTVDNNYQQEYCTYIYIWAHAKKLAPTKTTNNKQVKKSGALMHTEHTHIRTIDTRLFFHVWTRRVLLLNSCHSCFFPSPVGIPKTKQT